MTQDRKQFNAKEQKPFSHHLGSTRRNDTDRLTEEMYLHLEAPRPYLWWGVGDNTSLSVESVVDGILNGGDWEDVVALIDQLGIQRVNTIFQDQASRPRNNYRPQTINFFRHYFKKHA